MHENDMSNLGVLSFDCICPVFLSPGCLHMCQWCEIVKADRHVTVAGWTTDSPDKLKVNPAIAAARVIWGFVREMSYSRTWIAMNIRLFLWDLFAIRFLKLVSIAVRRTFWRNVTYTFIQFRVVRFLPAWLTEIWNRASFWINSSKHL